MFIRFVILLLIFWKGEDDIIFNIIEGGYVFTDIVFNYNVGEEDMIRDILGSGNIFVILFLIFREEEDDMIFNIVVGVY